MRKELNKTKQPWPTKEAMEQVYALNLWGENNSDFYSGDGSHHPGIVLPYLDAVISFFKSHDCQLEVCDLGCGDFNVGKELVKYSKKYIAVDIVENLILFNKGNFKIENLSFDCLDIAKDELPKGDCALIRQVLQHLSNFEIQSVLNKLCTFKYVILTEHIPSGEFIPNKDIISGQGIRIKKQSGLDVIAAPFNMKIKEEKELVRYILKNDKGLIITTLYHMY
jgi:hypothetical protein